MVFLLIMLFIFFPTMAIYGSFKIRKLNRKIDNLRSSTVSKEALKMALEELENTEKEKQLLEKTVRRYEYEKNKIISHDQFKISVSKDLMKKPKFKPSDLDKKQLEDCMNYYIENYAKR